VIDFRYHIVSLISVFLALAVGIVLGAGPLRDYIAESLSGQVEALRAETETLRDELDLTQTTLTGANDFIAEASPALVEDVLPSYEVSIIALPGSEPDTVEDVLEVLEESGASVANLVEMEADFTDPTKRPFRSGIAGNLAEYMDPEPSEEASSESIIGAALQQALTDNDPEEPQEPSEEATAIIDLLTTAELMSVEESVSPTHGIVVIGADTAVGEEQRAAELGLVKGISPQKVIVSGTDLEDSLLREIRTDSDASSTYTTTDSLTSAAGKVLVPRALATVLGGEQGSYGFGDGVDDILPPDQNLSEPNPPEAQAEEETAEANP